MKIREFVREKIREIKENLAALYLAYRRRDTPLIAKIAAIAAVGYALSPIDLIPDFIPVIGYLDDLVILHALILLAVRLIPKEIMAACREEAKSLAATPHSRRYLYAVPVVLIWIVLAVWLFRRFAG